jgi:hypothetical protein
MGLVARGGNKAIEKISEIETKLFEVIQQESPAEYGSIFVIEAIKLLLIRISGMSVSEG